MRRLEECLREALAAVAALRAEQREIRRAFVALQARVVELKVDVTGENDRDSGCAAAFLDLEAEEVSDLDLKVEEGMIGPVVDVE